jgi:hypothetical protein
VAFLPVVPLDLRALPPRQQPELALYQRLRDVGPRGIHASGRAPAALRRPVPLERVSEIGARLRRHGRALETARGDHRPWCGNRLRRVLRGSRSMGQKRLRSCQLRPRGTFSPRIRFSRISYRILLYPPLRSLRFRSPSGPPSE